jgi:hypothetical protein
MPDYYGNIADADTYHLARGNAAWALADTPTKEAALLIASDWIDGKYGGSFPGYPTNRPDQLRQWPRATAYYPWGTHIPDTLVPVQVERATYEVALRQVVSPGSLFVDWTAGTDKKSVSIAGAVSVTYAGSSSIYDAQLQIPAVDAILADVLNVSAGYSMYSGSSGRV